MSVPGTVLLESHPCSGERGSWLFRGPEETVVCARVDEIMPALRHIQARVAAGRYAAGCIAYEAAAAFDPALTVRAPDPGLPLLWFGLYRRREAVPPAAPPAAGPAASKRADTTARPPRKAKPHRVALRPKAPRLPVVIHAHGAAELQAFRRLTIAPGEVVAPADLPAKVGCPVSAPQARRVALMDGGSTVLCTRPGHGLDGARVPVLPPLDTALAAAVVPKSGPSVAPAVPLARRYVQIGAFSVPANAERALDRLQSLGLPAAVSRGQLDVVMAGPFADTQAIRAALTAARSAGYTDAFIRS